MTPTLLEGVVVLVLLGVAWQVGLVLAPMIRASWERQKEALDEASGLEEAEAVPELESNRDLSLQKEPSDESRQ